MTSSNQKKKIVTPTSRLLLYPVTKRHLNFLLKLWNDSEIMRYAGFAKNWDYKQIEKWYEYYKKNLAKYGNTETHFIIKLKNGKLVGESGLGILKKGWFCKNYKTPKEKLVLLADVKLAKKFWNKGYGTEAMKEVVRFVFKKTDADIFLVPPHKDSIPAIKVYEKANFKKTKGVWLGYHLIYEMKREDFKEIYGK